MARKSLVSVLLVTALTVAGVTAGGGSASALTVSSTSSATPLAGCAAPPNSPDATTANRDRFVSVWAPRVADKAWFSNFVSLQSVPSDILAEGFQAMDTATQGWLVACLVDNLVASSGQAATPGQVASYQLALDLVIFGKDQLATAKQQLNSVSSPPPLTPPATPAPSNLTADALHGMISRLSTQPSITSASLPRANVSTPSTSSLMTPGPSTRSPAAGKLIPSGLDPLALASSLQSILNVPLVALILKALAELEQLISNIQAVLFTLPVLNLASTLFYKVCAESATQPLACSVSLPIGVPIPVDVNGDHFPDVLAELLPVVANGTDFGVSFSVTRLLTNGPLPAHVFFVYDIPLANKRLEYGYDGRASTLANNTTTTVTLKNAFHALTGDINVAASVKSDNPGPVEGLTFAVKDLVGGSAGHPPTEANPVAGAVQFNPFPKTLTMGAHLTHNSQDEDIFSLTSSTPSTVNAVMDQDTTTTVPQSHREFTALIDKLPTSVTVDLTHNGGTQNISYSASAPIAHVQASDTATADIVNHPGSYTHSVYDVQGVPSSVQVTLTGAQDVLYTASAVIPQVTFATQTYRDSVLQQAITAQAQGIPASVHVSDVTGDTSTITYDASSVITSIAFSMYDLTQDQTNLSATATAIPTHMQFVQVKSTGLYDLSANAGIGLITATLTRGGGVFLADPGVDHATVYKRGNGLGLDFQLTGFQSAHFENATKTIVGLGLNPGGQAFDAIGDLDSPNVLATAHITQLPSTISVTADPATSSYTYNASSPINAGIPNTPDVSAAFTQRDTGDMLSAGITNLPATIGLTLDSANSKIKWSASGATGKVAVAAHITAATLGLPRGIDAGLTITGIPAAWTASYGSGNVDFEAPSPGISSIDAWVTNHSTHESMAGDFLAAYFDQPSGDLDAALHISNLSRATFTKLTDGNGGGFVADLNMGNQANFSFAATVNLGTPAVTTTLTASGSLNPLPSAIHLQSDGGRIQYTGNTNPTLTLSVAAGDPAALAVTPTPPTVHGVAIRDGQSSSGKALKANLYITGLPDGLDLNTPAGIYTVSNFNPSNPVLTVDAQLTTLAAQPLTLLLTQDVGVGPVSFVFGPFVSSTAGDGTHSMSVNYTASRDMSAFNAEVTYGNTDDAKLFISNIPGGGAPSISVNTAFGNTSSVDVTMTHGISEITASYKHVGDASFGGSVDLTNIPSAVHLKIGSQSTGDSTNGATAPQVTFTASQPGLNINAFASASIVNASAVASLMVTNMGSTVTGALNGMTLNITSSPATGTFLLQAAGHIHLNVDLGFSGGGFTNVGTLGVDLTIFSVTLGFTDATNLGLALGVTTGLTGDFSSFTFGQTSDLKITITDDLSFGFDLPIFGHQSIDLVHIPTVTLDFNNVIPDWHINTNTSGPIFTIPVFEIPFIITCGVDINARPAPGYNTGMPGFTLGPPPNDGHSPPAWLITPDLNVMGLSLPSFALDIIAFFESPYGNEISFSAGCH